MAGQFVVSGGFCVEGDKRESFWCFFLVIFPCDVPLEHSDSDHPGADVVETLLETLGSERQSSVPDPSKTTWSENY